MSGTLDLLTAFYFRCGQEKQNETFYPLYLYSLARIKLSLLRCDDEDEAIAS